MQIDLARPSICAARVKGAARPPRKLAPGLTAHVVAPVVLRSAGGAATIAGLSPLTLICSGVCGDDSYRVDGAHPRPISC